MSARRCTAAGPIGNFWTPVRVDRHSAVGSPRVVAPADQEAVEEAGAVGAQACQSRRRG